MMTDEFTHYEIGLEELLRQLGKDHKRYVLTFQSRLQENIDKARRYGDTNALSAERAQIVDNLNQLALSTVDMSLNELYELVQEGPEQKTPPAPPDMPSPPSSGGLWDWLSRHPEVPIAIGCIVVVLVTVLLFPLLRCVIEFRMTEATVALIGLLAVGAGVVFKVIPPRIRAVSQFLYGGFTVTLIVVVLVMKFLPPPSGCFAPPTPTTTPTSAPTVTSMLPPSPTVTPTPSPGQMTTPISTPTDTPTPTPDCQEVQIDYLELELNRGTTQKECPITLQRSDVEKLANLSGRAYFSGPGATQCRCTRCWMRIPAAEEMSIECTEKCSFSVPISDQVYKIFMKLDLYGSVKLCTITIE